MTKTTSQKQRHRTAPAVGVASVAPKGESSRFVITSQACSILDAFLQDPERPRYGLELMKITGLSSGTTYPVIYRFERAGWLTAAPEPIDRRRQEGAAAAASRSPGGDPGSPDRDDGAAP